MAKESSITVNILDRSYPLRVAESEVPNIQRVEQDIQQKLKDLKTNYGVSEKQDLLAMCLLQTLVEGKGQPGSKEDLRGKLEDLESFVSDYLKSKA